MAPAVRFSMAVMAHTREGMWVAVVISESGFDGFYAARDDVW
jgi:hypothetical protein